MSLTCIILGHEWVFNRSELEWHCYKCGKERFKKEVNITLSSNEAEILLTQLKEIKMRTTTVNWIIKYLERKLRK